MDRKDVRVLKASGELDFPEESLRAQGSCELGMEDLQCDGTVVAEVLGQVNDCHAASAELSVDAVAVGECGREVVADI